MKTTPQPLQQSPGFAAALRQLGRDAQIEPCGADGQVLIIRRRFGPLGAVRFASRGPVWQAGVGPVAQLAALRRIRIDLINADGTSDAVLRAAGYRKLVTAAHVAELPLLGNAEQQQALCQGKWRNRAIRAADRGVRVLIGPFDPRRDAVILAEDRAQQTRKRFAALPHEVTLAFARTQPSACLTAWAWHGDQPVAAMIFLSHGTVATYQIGWSSAAGRAVSAHHLTLLRAADHLAALGHVRLDLGLVDTEAAPGLARFKIGSGATVRPLGGTWGRLPRLWPRH